MFKFIAHDDPSGKDLSWIDDVSDQLAVHIALHEYEQAVALVEQAKSIFAIVEADPIAIGLLKIKVEIRTSELNQVLLATLADKNIRKTSVIRVSGWLLRLGQGERARETFLAGRGELLKHRTGEIHFTSQDGGGHANRTSSDSSNSVVEEVAELAFVCFTLIRNTCEWYMAAYKDHQTASGELLVSDELASQTTIQMLNEDCDDDVRFLSFRSMGQLAGRNFCRLVQETSLLHGDVRRGDNSEVSRHRQDPVRHGEYPLQALSGFTRN